jgi:hypothetical protein
MISKGAASVGTANAAALYSSNDSGPDMVSSAMSASRIAQINGVRAINHSFGIGGALDGKSLYTSVIDWSASRYDVLNVIAGNETGPSLNTNIPTDSYNGMVVSYTRQDGMGVYNQIDPGNVVNHLPTDGRRTVDIAAPGSAVTMELLNNVSNNTSNGTSFAAPHVTAADALLEQYSQNQRIAGNARFGANSQRHEVMKAIMMNSADKRAGVLGMTKTITRIDGDDWITQRQQEVAGTDQAGGGVISRDSVPLDTELGTGQLNVSRAVTQLAPGEYNPGAAPAIGWDYDSLATGTSINRYEITPNLAKNGWVSITLDWDRRVNLSETFAGFANNTFDGETFIDTNNSGGFNAGEPLYDINNNGTYNQGVSETFTDHLLQDLDLYLVPHNGGVGDAVARSISSIYSVEHIFFQLDATKQYDILVRSLSTNTLAQNYGLAWWTQAVPEPAASVLLLSAILGLTRLRRRPG